MGAESVDIRAGGKILNDAGQVYAGKGMTLEAPEIIARGRPVHTDRKSTRLNSSHLVISYAVFCLKKKNMSSLLGRGRVNISCEQARLSRSHCHTRIACVV